METEAKTTLAEIEEFTDQYGYVHAVNPQRPPLCGGQGCVFFTNDEHYAGKICFVPGSDQEPSTDTQQNEEFARLRLLPIPQEARVTLPLATLEEYHGYLMRLLDGMASFDEALVGAAEEMPVLAGIPEPYRTRLEESVAAGGLRRSLMAYRKAACSLAMLHARGLVYCDFSERNAFLSQDVEESNMQLIDADNIEYEEHLEEEPRIAYTPGIGAPELVRQDGGCSFWSDCYAFANALFRRLYLQHPFEGEQYEAIAEEEDLDNAAEMASETGELAWILDEDDDSNADVAPLAPQFLLPDGLRRLFQETFSAASRAGDLAVRPTMMEWAEALAYAEDNTVRGACGLDYLACGRTLAEASVCPWDDAATHVLRLTSYRQTKTGRRRVWQYTHELTEPLLIPYRIVAGFSCRGGDKPAFEWKRVEGQWVLRAVALFDEIEGGIDDIHFAHGARFYLERDHYTVHLVAGKGQDIRMEVELS